MKVQKQEFRSLAIPILMGQKHFGEEGKEVEMGKGSPRVKEESDAWNETEKTSEDKDKDGGLQFFMEIEEN